jgi:hypothetical protein
LRMLPLWVLLPLIFNIHSKNMFCLCYLQNILQFDVKCFSLP